MLESITYLAVQRHGLVLLVERFGIYSSPPEKIVDPSAFSRTDSK
jgi:hypothetical protein